MTTSTYLVAYEEGRVLPPRYGEPVEHKGEGRAHAIKAWFAPDAQAPFAAACGAPVSFIVNDQEWPPVGVPRCQECNQQVG